MKTLQELGLKHGTDKATHHKYLDTYQTYLWQGRTSPIRLLELGVKDGASLRMWREYFTNPNLIAGVDSSPDTAAEFGCTVSIGSQTDADLLNRLGGDWDVVIDDCSHINVLTIDSFAILWPQVKPGGIYIVEDVMTSYLPEYGGSTDPHNPTGQTAMSYFKWLADQVNFRVGNAAPGDYLDEKYNLHMDIAMIAFHPGFVVVRKA